MNARKMSAFTETSRNVAFSDDNPDDYRDSDVNSKRDRVDNWSHDEGGENSGGLTDSNDNYYEGTPKKRVRIRVPVVRRNGRQHKLTVVRRRPVVSRTKDPPLSPASHTPRRIVVTRVRTLGLAGTVQGDDFEGPRPEVGRHKVTITRRRKLEPTPTLATTEERRGRITRKRLIAVRPIEPTPSFAIITTGFFTVPSSEYEEEYSEEEEGEEDNDEEEVATTTFTPELGETPDVVDSTPGVTDSEDKGETVEPKALEGTATSEPVIITDHFFFPASDDEYEEYEEYPESTTTERIREQSGDEELPMTTKPPEVDDKDDVTTIPEVPVVTEKVETAVEKPVDVSDNVGDHETTTEVPSEEDSTSDEFLTTAKPADREDVTTQADSSDTLQEDSFTTSSPEVAEEEEDEKEHSTIGSVEETTVPVEETTIMSVPENQPEATTVAEEEVTTTTEKEDARDSTEYAMSSTESSVSETLPKDTGRSFGEEAESNAENSVQKEVESRTATAPSVESQTERPSVDMEDNVEKDAPVAIAKSEEKVEIQTVQPIKPDVEPTSSKSSSDTSTVPFDLPSIDIASSFATVLPLETSQPLPSDTTAPNYLDDSDIPSVIPLEVESTHLSEPRRTSEVSEATPTLDTPKVTTSISSPTPEDIEAGLADDLYLSLSRPDFPEILPSKPTATEHRTKSTPDLEPSTSVYYTETVVTSTRLRTYTYVVTQQNGLETKVTSSTTVRPRVTTLTLTVPVTVTITPTVESPANSVSSVYNPVPVVGE